MKLNILPGEEIFLRLELKDVRKSQFCEILPDDLIAIEQTLPPLEPPQLNHTVLLTYKTHEENAGRRGFDARIEQFTADYRVIVRQLSDPAPCDLRVWPRIRLDLFPEIKAFCRDKEIQLIDISGGGTHVIVQKDDCASLEIGMIMKLRFVFEKGEAPVDGKILRIWKDFFQKDHLAIEFQGNNNISQFIY